MVFFTFISVELMVFVFALVLYMQLRKR